MFDALKKTKIILDIIVVKFIELVVNLDTNLVCNMLCFQYNELPTEYIIENNIGMYIHVNIDGVHVKKTLIDIGYNVNICLV